MLKKTEYDAINASGKDILFDSILSTSTLIGMPMAKLFGFYADKSKKLINYDQDFSLS